MSERDQSGPQRLPKEQLVLVLTIAVPAALMIVAAVLPQYYLTHYLERHLITGALLSIVTLHIALGTWIISQPKVRTHRISAAYSILWLVLTGCVISPAILARITYQSFGLTVVGLVPIPLLDVTISSSGLLWFRDKSHTIVVRELERLLDHDTELVIVGIGWSSGAQLEQAASGRFGSRIRVLRTPDAVQEFNRLKRLGKRVSLVLHTTC